MAGGPGAAGVPASSARSPPRPHALAGFRVGRAEGWRRRGGGRRRAAARSRVRPAYLGRGGAPGAAPPPGPGGRGPARLLSLSAKKGPAGARRASGGGRCPRSGSPGRVSRRGDPSPQPAASSHASPLTSARRTPAARQTCEPDPAFGEGRRARRLRPRPRKPPPHAGRSGSAACGVRGDAPRVEEGTGDEVKPVRSFFHAALQAGREREETGVGGTGMKGVWGPGSQNNITSGIAHLAQSGIVSQGG